MDKEEVLRVFKGLIKKHGTDFSVRLKYITSSNKTRKRHGKFLAMEDEEKVLLHNPDKGTDSWYQLDRIIDIKKM